MGSRRRCGGMTNGSAFGHGQAKLTEAEITRLDERLETFDAAFAAKARGLHAAERDRCAGEFRAVHRHHREIEAADHLKYRIEAFRTEVGGESIFGVVRAFDDF